MTLTGRQHPYKRKVGAVQLITWKGSSAAEQGRTMSMLTSPAYTFSEVIPTA